MSNRPLTPTVLPDILCIQISEHIKLKLKSSDLERLGAGGTAVVYSYTHDNVTKAIKIYHKEILEEHSEAYSRKLEYMLHHRPQNMEFTLKSDNQTYTQFVWPEAIVCDKDGQLLGYIMPILPTDKLISLSTYNNPRRISRINKKYISITARIQTARNLAAAMNNLHKDGHYFIDVKPQNIFILEENGLVCFLDCDGYSINRGEFPAQHYTNGYQLPEALRQNIRPSDLSNKPYQDYYCLAHLIFEILNYGNKPFNGIPTNPDNREEMEAEQGGSYTYKVKHKWYPYGFTPHSSINPHEGSIYQYLPRDILRLFEKAFIGEASKIPSAIIWYKVLTKYCAKEMFQKCDTKPNSLEHHHFRAFGCFACALENNNAVQDTIIDDGIEQTSTTGLVESEGESPFKSISILFSTIGNPTVSSHPIAPIPALDAWIEFADKNQLDSYQIPRTYQELEELKVLDLSHLGLTSVPVIEGFTNLEELYLNNNQLKNIEFKAYSLPNLRVINLSSNELYELPKSICSLENLEALYLTNNNLSFLNSTQLLKLKKLGIFSIEYNQIDNFSPKYFLKYFPNLIVYDAGNPYKKTSNTTKEQNNVKTEILKEQIDDAILYVKKNQLERYNDNMQIFFNLIFVGLGLFLCYVWTIESIGWFEMLLAILGAIFTSIIIAVFLVEYLLDSIFLYRYSFKSEEKIDKSQVKCLFRQGSYVEEGDPVIFIGGKYYYSPQDGFISYTEVDDVYEKGTIIFKIEYMKKWDKK